MPEKQKARSWKELQTVIAAACMLVSFALCNLIASFERHDEKNLSHSGAHTTASAPQPERRPEDGRLPEVVVTSTGSS